MLGSEERGKVRVMSHENIFQEFHLYGHDTSTLQTDKRTDGQLALAIPRSATLREVKNSNRTRQQEYVRNAAV